MIYRRFFVILLAVITLLNTRNAEAGTYIPEPIVIVPLLVIVGAMQATGAGAISTTVLAFKPESSIAARMAIASGVCGVVAYSILAAWGHEGLNSEGWGLWGTGIAINSVSLAVGSFALSRQRHKVKVAPQFSRIGGNTTVGLNLSARF